MNQILKEIPEELVRLLHEMFGVPYSSLIADNWSEPLTGSKMNLNGMDLVYLFFELEKHFKVRIDQQHLVSYGFCSIRHIEHVIEQSFDIEKINP